MERTKKSIQNLTARQIQVLTSVLVARNNMARQFGQQFGGERDLYKALGYPTQLTYDDFIKNYTRHDISKAVIDRPVKATWQGQLELVESEEAERTPFEQGWYDLNKKFKLRSLFSRVDRLTGIGRYGILLLGLDDVKNTEGFRVPVSKGERTLKYIKPFGENSAKIDTWETRPTNPRYGMPLTYNIQVANVSNGSSMTVTVHHSRIIHITDDTLESEVYGTPRLEAVFNRMMDIEKLVGGDAEMFWKGARPGYQGVLDKEFTRTKETDEELDNQIEEYENDLKRILITEGVDLKALAQQIADPSSHLDAQLTCVSAVTGIPKRILSGSERGELASTQDSGEWKTYVQSRREDHAEPHIIAPFVERLIEYGILPAPENDYMVDWLDLFSISEKERVEIGKGRSNAIREYTTNPLAASIMPPKAFFELCLGLSQAQIDLVERMIAEGISTEQKDLMEEMTDITAPPLPPVLPGSPKAVGSGKPGMTRKPAAKVTANDWLSIRQRTKWVDIKRTK
jgi:hypothetical protein